MSAAYQCLPQCTGPDLNASIYFMKEKSFAKRYRYIHKHCNSIKVDQSWHCVHIASEREEEEKKHHRTLKHLPTMNNQVLIRINGLSFVIRM